MDETQYRSAANIHYGLSLGTPPATYGYGNSAGAEYCYTSTYSEPAFDPFTAEAASQQRMRQIYLEQSGVRSYTDNMIRRYIRTASFVQSCLTSI